jgi:hypothetical protein
MTIICPYCKQSFDEKTYYERHVPCPEPLSDAVTKRPGRVCEVCGADISRAAHCTNSRCMACHEKHCTPGGSTSPGHGRDFAATPYAVRGTR